MKQTLLVFVKHEDEPLAHPKILQAWSNRHNNELNENLSRLHRREAELIRRRMSEAGASPQAEHLFREVVVGAYFARSESGTPLESSAVEGWAAIVDLAARGGVEVMQGVLHRIARQHTCLLR